MSLSVDVIHPRGALDVCIEDWRRRPVVAAHVHTPELLSQPFRSHVARSALPSKASSMPITGFSNQADEAVSLSTTRQQRPMCGAVVARVCRLASEQQHRTFAVLTDRLGQHGNVSQTRAYRRIGVGAVRQRVGAPLGPV